MLIKKDLLLDYRKRFALGGILLYTVTVVFIVYRSFGSTDMTTWNVLLWILFLFLALNAVLKSFTQESSNTALYYYLSVDPVEFIIAKVFYNWLTLLILGTILIIVYSFFLGFPIENMTNFATIFVLSSLGVAICFSFVASIASQLSNSGTLIAILSLPLVVPILLSAIKTTSVSMENAIEMSSNVDILSLLAIDFILLGATIIIFPFIWRS